MQRCSEEEEAKEKEVALTCPPKAPRWAFMMSMSSIFRALSAFTIPMFATGITRDVRTEMAQELHKIAEKISFCKVQRQATILTSLSRLGCEDRLQNLRALLFRLLLLLFLRCSLLRVHSAHSAHAAHAAITAAATTALSLQLCHPSCADCGKLVICHAKCQCRKREAHTQVEFEPHRKESSTLVETADVHSEGIAAHLVDSFSCEGKEGSLSILPRILRSLLCSTSYY